jgi:hypothetical protein
MYRDGVGCWGYVSQLLDSGLHVQKQVIELLSPLCMDASF